MRYLIRLLGLFALLGPVAATAQTAVPLTQPFLRTVQPGVHLIADGNYGGGFRLSRGGTQANPLVLRAEHPGNVVITGGVQAFRVEGAHWVTLDGFTFTQANIGLRITGSNHGTISHCRSFGNATSGILTGSSSILTITYTQADHNVAEHGIYIGESRGVIIDHCVATDNGKAGIQLNGAGPGGPVADVVISNNEIARNGQTRQAAAVNLLDVWGVVVIGNTFSDNLTNGITVSYSPARTIGGKTVRAVAIIGNTISFQPGQGWRVFAGGGSGSYDHNIITYTRTSQIVDPSSPAGVFADGGGNVINAGAPTKAGK
jgi:hypothetical protein